MLKKATCFVFFALVLTISFSAHALKKTQTIILDSGHGGKDQGGYDGRGFTLEDGRRVPEDAYTFDVAKRIERHVLLQQQNILFSVVADVPIQTEASGEILSPLRNVFYNFPHQKIRVFGGKEGVEKRLEAIRQFGPLTAHTTVFVSLHFDYAPAVVSGTRIFTTRDGAHHPFVKILEKYFSSAGLSLHIRGEAKPSITVHENLIVLKDGIIVPRVLIELGNWNDPRDRALMLSPAGRERYAEVLARALTEYFYTLDTLRK